MTEQEAQAMINEASAIDQGEANHQEAAAEGRLDPRGQVIEANPDAAAMEWFIIPKTMAWAITAVFPETAPHYTDEKCMELARAIVPVAEKYGINGIGESPELMLLFGVGMFGAPGYLAYKARKAKAEADEKTAKAGTAENVVEAASNGG